MLKFIFSLFSPSSPPRTAVLWSVATRKKAGDGLATADRPGGISAGAASSKGAGTDAGAAVSGITEMPARGQALEKKRVIHLPDGSMVILNKHSKLDYPVAFTASARDVTLSGEAYFDIVHRPGQPFLVHTGKLVTRVLGTAFNIKAYPRENAIEVTVDHGKVQVMKGLSSMGMLTDNQQIRYDRAGTTMPGTP